MRIVVINHLTLDGVMQGPGRADEDTRDGFDRGGWSPPYGDEVMGRFLGERMRRSGGALLFGRRTYQDLLGYWNSQDESPYRPALNDAQKFVASTTLREPLPWPNSTLLEGDVPTAVRELRRATGGDITIMGSGELIRSLIPHYLIDEYLLMIHPLVLGSGHRLFDENGSISRLELLDSTTTTTGVVIATYGTSRD